MRTVIQRVRHARVEVDQQVVGQIGHGLLMLVGFEPADTDDDLQWLAAKVAALRIFDDGQGAMNLALPDVDGQVLVVSQFTLHARTKKGSRPSFVGAAPAEMALARYGQFVRILEQALGKPVQTGQFGANMQVHLLNDGPVTIIIDTKNRE